MRETLLQLRIALHINKNKHRVLDRKARENKQRAENLQKKLNTVVANVNRSRQKATNIITETDSRYNNNNSAGFLEIINLKDLLLIHGIVELFVFLIFIILLYYRWVRNRNPNASYLFMVFIGLLGMLYGALLGGEYYH